MVFGGDFLVSHGEAEDALSAGVFGGSSVGRNAFGAYGKTYYGKTITIAGKVIPYSINIHLHAVLTIAPVWQTLVPVCERASSVVHQGVILHPPVMR